MSAETAELMALVKNEVTGKTQLNIDALPKDMAKQVVAIGGELQKEMQALGKSALKVAGLFSKAQELLEGKGYFVAFINSVPGFSQNTVYRMIRRYKNASKAFADSPATLQLALATGTEIAGEDEKKPFGKFTDAVKKVGPPPKTSGDEKEDRRNANAWLDEVKTTQEKDWHKKTRGSKSNEELIKSAVNGFMNNYNKVEAVKQMGFIKDVFGYVLFKLGVPPQTISPKQPGKTLDEMLVSKKEKVVEGESENGTGKKGKGKKK